MVSLISQVESSKAPAAITNKYVANATVACAPADHALLFQAVVHWASFK